MWNKIKGYLKKLFKILKKPEMAILPANIAFYLILAIIPLLTIVVLIASYFDISIEMFASMIESIMPTQVSDTLVGAISGKGFDGNVGFFNIIAFVLASNGTYAIITTSNALYKIKNTDYLKERISSIVILLIIIILFIFLLVVPIFGENILSLMHNAKILEKYADEVIIIFNIFKWPVTLLIIYFNIKLIYTIAPSKNIKSSETTYGAIFTTILWIIATIVFKFYIEYFARYDILYGNLSSIIIMMVWVYFLSYIFVFGMAINVSNKEEQELFEETQRLELEQIEKERKQAILKKKKAKEKEATKKIKEDQKSKEVITKIEEVIENNKIQDE